MIKDNIPINEVILKCDFSLNIEDQFIRELMTADLDKFEILLESPRGQIRIPGRIRVEYTVYAI